MKFRGQTAIFGILLVTMFLPGVMFLIPNFLTVNALGWMNWYAGVMAPAISGVFGVFFMRQFFLSLPRELEEAAYIDGATRLQTFRFIALPLAKPALATLGIITFLAAWNDFLWPLLVLKDRNLLTLPPGLAAASGRIHIRIRPDDGRGRDYRRACAHSVHRSAALHRRECPNHRVKGG